VAQHFKFKPPAWTGEPVLIAELWTLHKTGRRASCTLWNHPIGAELRLDVEGRDRTSLAGADLEPLLDVSVRWNNELEAQARWTERLEDEER
jgi:hypothetical protein